VDTVEEEEGRNREEDVGRREMASAPEMKRSVWWISVANDPTNPQSVRPPAG
jgi:hypothetical protein